MTIKAVLRQGVIEPLDPLPADWTDGKELVVEESQADSAAAIEQWSNDLDVSAAQIPTEEHERFLNALDQIERESKESVRKQWSQP